MENSSIDIKPNSKPLLLKRFIADGFDIMCIFVLFVILSIFIENTDIAGQYKSHMERYQIIEKEVVENNDSDDIQSILMNNEEYQNEVFGANLHHYLLVCLEIFISEFIFLCLIPLIRKDGLSLGKYLTGIILFDESRQSMIRKTQVIVRFIYIYFEGILLYPWTGIYTFVLIPVLRFIVMMLNSKNKTVCDYISGTMCIEKLSYRSFE